MKLVKAMILISMIFAFSLVSVAESRREKLSLKNRIEIKVNGTKIHMIMTAMSPAEASAT
jgi:hypothetical protein